MKTGELMKAGLSEIFAALSGITSAAVTRSQNGHQIKEDALVARGVESAHMSYSMKCDLVQNPSPKQQEKLAQAALKFLKSTGSILVWYEGVVLSHPGGNEGKSVRDVLLHIEDILEREKHAAKRPEETLVRDGVFVGKINADYLPGHGRRSTVHAEDTNFAKRGSKKTYAWERRAPAPSPLA